MHLEVFKLSLKIAICHIQNDSIFGIILQYFVDLNPTIPSFAFKQLLIQGKVISVIKTYGKRKRWTKN